MIKKFISSIENIISSFQGWQRTFFILLVILLTVGFIGSLVSLNQLATEKVPAHGGTHIEGIIGAPRFINPVLANTDVDRDISRLVYSGLTRQVNGELIMDLADSYTVSDDGLVYVFTLKDNIAFHDGASISSDDIIFTLRKVQDSTLESPERLAWRGVSLEKVDQRTVQFTLSEPYAGFLDNTTIGILPEHLWGSLNNDQFAFTDMNINAIGSGPYEIKSIKQNNIGITARISLRAFKDFTFGEPLLERMVMRFYANEESLFEAFESKKIDGVSALDPERAAILMTLKKSNLHRGPLPRVFGMFVNQNQASAFLDEEVIQAFDVALNKDALIKRALQGFGTPLYGPIPPDMLGYVETTPEERTLEERLAAAGELLEDAGWDLDEDSGLRVKSGSELTFTLATSNTPELKEVATIITNRLLEIGVTTEVQVFETGTLEQDIIRPRNYQALLFGQSLQHDTDLFAFWHSSQRNDPGLNIALFTNASADQALEDARETLDPKEREALYEKLQEEIAETSPAVFLYTPDFLYMTRKPLSGVSLAKLKSGTDRFNNVYEWYKQDERLWKPFITRN